MEHLEKKNWTARRMGRVELVFYEGFNAKPDAIRRERYFKTVAKGGWWNRQTRTT